MDVVAGANFAGDEPPPPPPNDADIRSALVLYSIPVTGVGGVEAFDMIVNVSHLFSIGGEIRDRSWRFKEFSLRPTRQMSAVANDWEIRGLVARDIGSLDLPGQGIGELAKG